MPIFQSAYDTTFGRRYQNDAVENAIIKATLSNYLSSMTGYDKYKILDDTNDWPVEVPAFGHPFYIKKEPYDGIYVDARPFISRNRQTGELKVTSQADYNMLLNRAGLEYIWRNEPVARIRSLSVYPASVYANWLSENISKRFALEPEDQYKLTIWSAWFYYSLFSDEVKPDEQEYLRVCQAIARATRIGIETIFQVLDDKDYVEDIIDYCNRMEDAVGNIRLRGFSPIVLYPILSSTWFGANSAEIVAVAVEHPPTFMAMIGAAMSERAYSRSLLSKMMERVPAKKLANEFLLQTTAILK